VPLLLPLAPTFWLNKDVGAVDGCLCRIEHLNDSTEGGRANIPAGTEAALESRTGPTLVHRRPMDISLQL
jgi:hypothetical protein